MTITIDEQSVQLLALLAVIAAVAKGYGSYFGPPQAQLSEWLITALKVESEQKGVVNLAVGILLATAFSVIGAWYLHDWFILPVGVLAGVLASVEAGKVHDQKAEQEKPPEQKPTPLVVTGEARR